MKEAHTNHRREANVFLNNDITALFLLSLKFEENERGWEYL